MEEILFSIIVPVYNVEKYLNKCVESILKQTYKNIEIILVDDGSPDESPRICDEYSALDSRVKTIHKKNGGLSDARNSGLEASKGKYIIFVDSDDYVTEDMCETLAKYTSVNPEIIVTDGIVVGGNIDLRHYNLKINHVYSGEEYITKCLANGNLPMAAWLNVYEKDFLINNNLKFKKGILHEDEQFTPRALLVSSRIVYTGTSHYNYIIREDSITTKKDKRKNARDFYETCLELADLYEKIDRIELKRQLQDLLVCKYLSLFQIARLYEYGCKYIKKNFVMKYAYKTKTKLKAALFCISPKLYWNINCITKKHKRYKSMY